MSPRVSILPILLAILTPAGCEHASPTVQSRVPKVRVAQPVERDVTDYAYFSGNTAAAESVDIQARVTGYLESIDFKPGSEMKAGTRLFKIDPRTYQADYDVAVSQVELCETKLKLAQANYRRSLEVSKTPGAISQEDLDSRLASQDAAAAEVEAAKAKQKAAKVNLDFTDVLCPIDGVVGRDLITVGNLVTQDNTLLTTVVSQDPMYVYFDADEQLILRVERLVGDGKIPSLKAGDVVPVQMALADEKDKFAHEGKLNYVGNQLDRSTGTIQVRAEFPNPPINESGSRMLRAGFFVKVRLPIGPAYKALVVPQSAIGADQGRKYLLVVGENNLVEYRPIEPGAQQADGLQVVFPVKMVRSSDGLRPAGENDKETVPSVTAADRVVVGGLQRVRPGTKVEIRTEPGASH